MKKKQWTDKGYKESRYGTATPFLDSGHEHRVENTETGEKRAIQVYSNQTLEEAVKTGNQWTEVNEPQKSGELSDSRENASQVNAEADKTSGKSPSAEARKFSDKQIVAILQEAAREETTIRDLCRSHGISESRFYKWRRRYEGMSPEQVTRVRKLKAENVSLKDEPAERKAELKTGKKRRLRKS